MFYFLYKEHKKQLWPDAENYATGYLQAEPKLFNIESLPLYIQVKWKRIQHVHKQIYVGWQ